MGTSLNNEKVKIDTIMDFASTDSDVSEDSLCYHDMCNPSEDQFEDSFEDPPVEPNGTELDNHCNHIFLDPKIYLKYGDEIEILDADNLPGKRICGHIAKYRSLDNDADNAEMDEILYWSSKKQQFLLKYNKGRAFHRVLKRKLRRLRSPYVLKLSRKKIENINDEFLKSLTKTMQSFFDIKARKYKIHLALRTSEYNSAVGKMKPPPRNKPKESMFSLTKSRTIDELMKCPENNRFKPSFIDELFKPRIWYKRGIDILQSVSREENIDIAGIMQDMYDFENSPKSISRFFQSPYKEIAIFDELIRVITLASPPGGLLFTAFQRIFYVKFYLISKLIRLRLIQLARTMRLITKAEQKCDKEVMLIEKRISQIDITMMWLDLNREEHARSLEIKGYDQAFDWDMELIVKETYFNKLARILQGFSETKNGEQLLKKTEKFDLEEDELIIYGRTFVDTLKDEFSEVVDIGHYVPGRFRFKKPVLSPRETEESSSDDDEEEEEEEKERVEKESIDNQPLESMNWALEYIKKQEGKKKKKMKARDVPDDDGSPWKMVNVDRWSLSDSMGLEDIILPLDELNIPLDFDFLESSPDFLKEAGFQFLPNKNQ